MFTGLTEEQGTIKNVSFSSEGAELTVECKQILSDMKKGASICVSGACLSVTDFGKNYITLQVSNETLKITGFDKLKQGEKVNLERALTVNKRIDGHIVSGHVDCRAEFLRAEKDGFSQKFFFKIDKNFSKYLIYKGSVAINGVSLTVASVDGDIFSVELIPITLKEVNLSSLKKGDFVNIECDIFAKYIEKLLNSKDNVQRMDYGFLVENGFA